MAKKYKYTCDECGGTDVEMRQWVKPNEDFKVSDDCIPDNSDTWCKDCEDHTGIILEETE